MISKLRKRIQREEQGFTLIELLVVVIILGILTAIAIPSYLSFKDRASDTAAKADIRAVLPSIESWYADNNTYATMSLDSLKATYDQALDTNKYVLTSLTTSSYCIQSPRTGSRLWKKAGPSAAIVSGAC